MASFLGEIGAVALSLVEWLVRVYTYAVFGAVVISWVGADPGNPIVRFVRQITDPLLSPARRWLWPLTRRLQLDLSPMLIVFGLMIVETAVRRLRLQLLLGG